MHTRTCTHTHTPQTQHEYAHPQLLAEFAEISEVSEVNDSPIPQRRSTYAGGGREEDLRRGSTASIQSRHLSVTTKVRRNPMELLKTLRLACRPSLIPALCRILYKLGRSLGTRLCTWTCMGFWFVVTSTVKPNRGSDAINSCVLSFAERLSSSQMH